MATAYLGVAAAVGIPAFIKYIRRAKASEAIDQLDKIAKGATVYYTTPTIARDGTKLPCRFPDSVKTTPPAGTCCKSKDGRCPASVDDWNHETWSQLSFQVNDAHFFSYKFSSSGEGANARFTATAYGDLDCDGVFSTFERYGFGEGTRSGECTMDMPVATYKENETE